MEERLRKLEEALHRCEAAAHRLSRREATLRQAARETIVELERLLKAGGNG